MSENSVQCKKSGTIGIITIHHPTEDNVVDARLAAEFQDACNAVNVGDTIRVVIVTGAEGRSFCRSPGKPEIQGWDGKNSPGLLSIASAAARIKCPTIAAINGDAVGQGLELALACNLRIASKKATFSMPQVAAGFIPWDGGTQRLQRIAGFTKAMEMILTGQSIDAMEALQIGLVSRVEAPQDLMPQAEAMAKSMAAQSPLALQFAKEAIEKGMDLTLEQGLRLEADLYFLLHTTSDRTEGIKSFREKRPPHFTGS